MRPGREPTYQYDENKRLVSSTAYVKKQTRDGTWHEIGATAFFNEYCQTYKDKSTGQQKLTQFWAEEIVQATSALECAEALSRYERLSQRNVRHSILKKRCNRQTSYNQMRA